MRNLKKMLSLVMALAMVASFMVVGASAAEFSDAKDIKNADAVNTLVSLGVIKGYEDGSYKPEGTVTRAEMAKMITIILNGGRDPQLGSSNASYTDTVGHWAAGYIEFCTNLGIVAGRGGNKFEPNATVTGSEAAKMALVAAGYNAETSEMVGVNWAIKTDILANQNDLYADLSTLNPSQPLIRDDAAQLLYNALSVEMVKLSDGKYVTSEYSYKETTSIQTGTEIMYRMTSKGGTVTEGNAAIQALDGSDYRTYADAQAAATAADSSAAVLGTNYTLARVTVPVYGETVNVVTATETIGHKNLSLLTTSGVLSNVSYDSVKKNYNVTLSGGAYFTKVANDPSALMGQKVKVLFKAYNDVYGVFASGSTVVATGVLGDVSTPITTGVKEIKFDGTTYKTTDTVNNTEIYNFNVSAVAGNVFSDIATMKAVNAATPVTLIDNDEDGKIDLIVVRPFTVERVTYVGSDSITFSVSGSQAKDEITYTEGLKKDDYVIATHEDNTVDDTKVFEKIEVISGKVEAKKSNSIKIADEWYDRAGSAVINVEAYGLDDTVSVVSVNGYYFNVKIGDTASTELVYLSANKAFDSFDKTVSAKAYFTDGTNKVIKITELDGSDVTSAITADTIHQTLYTYSVDGDEYSIKTVNGNNLAGYTYYKAGSTTFTAKSGSTQAKLNSVLFDDSAVVFVEKANGSVTVMKGTEAQKLGTLNLSGSTYLTKAYSGYSKIGAATILLSDNTLGVDGDLRYGYVTANSAKFKDGNDYYMTMTIQTADGKREFNAECASGDSEGSAPYIKGSFISYKVVDENTIKSVTALPTSTTSGNGIGAVVATDGTNLEIKDSAGTILDGKKITDDTFIIYIDSKNKAGAEGGTIQEATETPTAGEYWYNVLVMETADNEIDVLFVDVNNKLTLDGGSTYPTTDTRVDLTVTNVTSIQGSSSDSTVANFSAAVDKTTDVKPGETVTVTVTYSNAAVIGDQGVKLTLTNAAGDVLGFVTYDAIATFGGSSIVKTITFKAPVADATLTLTIADIHA